MKLPQQEYPAEFKELAIERVKKGQAVGMLAKEPVLVAQTLPRSARLVAEAAHDSGHRDRCADNGKVPPKADDRCAAPLGSGQPMHQPGVPGQARRVWHDLLDEPQGKLLGQRAQRELVQQPEERAGACPPLHHIGRGHGGHLRVNEMFYNRKRRHLALGYRLPPQFLKDWISAQNDEKLVA